MKAKKKATIVSSFVTGRQAVSQKGQTANQPTAEELRKYASGRPVRRPPSRGKKGA